MQPTLSTKQNKLTCPSEDDSDGWRLVSDENIARRLIGDDKIQVAGVLDLANGSNYRYQDWFKHKSDKTDQLPYQNKN